MLQSLSDLKAAEWNLEGGFFNTVCFLAQQSVEKALKSALYYSGASRTKLMTHSTVQLLAETGVFMQSAESLMDDAREVHLHYIPSRYPNGLPGGYPHSFYTEKAARSALGCAERIVEADPGYYSQKGFALED